MKYYQKIYSENRKIDINELCFLLGEKNKIEEFIKDILFNEPEIGVIFRSSREFSTDELALTWLIDKLNPSLTRKIERCLNNIFSETIYQNNERSIIAYEKIILLSLNNQSSFLVESFRKYLFDNKVLLERRIELSQKIVEIEDEFDFDFFMESLHESNANNFLIPAILMGLLKDKNINGIFDLLKREYQVKRDSLVFSITEVIIDDFLALYLKSKNITKISQLNDFISELDEKHWSKEIIENVLSYEEYNFYHRFIGQLSSNSAINPEAKFIEHLKEEKTNSIIIEALANFVIRNLEKNKSLVELVNITFTSLAITQNVLDKIFEILLKNRSIIYEKKDWRKHLYNFLRICSKQKKWILAQEYILKKYNASFFIKTKAIAFLNDYVSLSDSSEEKVEEYIEDVLQKQDYKSKLKGIVNKLI